MRLSLQSFLAVFALSITSNAMEVSFEVKNPEEAAGRKGLNYVQQLVFMSEDGCNEKMPKKLRALADLPRIAPKIVDPLTLFSSGASGVNQNFYPVRMNHFLITDLKTLKVSEAADAKFLQTVQIPGLTHLTTENLCECVGVSIFIPGVMAGLIHAGFKASENGTLRLFLAQIPSRLLANAHVRIVSSVYSGLLLEVCDAVKAAGLTIESLDVPDHYLDCKGRTSNGVKYFSYERLGLSVKDAIRIQEMPQAQISQMVESRACVSPRLGETPRVLILKLANGETGQFFEEGHGSINSGMFEILYITMRTLAELPPQTQMATLLSTLKRVRDHVITTSRKQARDFMTLLDSNEDTAQQILEFYKAP